MTMSWLEYYLSFIQSKELCHCLEFTLVFVFISVSFRSFSSRGCQNVYALAWASWQWTKHSESPGKIPCYIVIKTFSWEHKSSVEIWKNLKKFIKFRLPRTRLHNIFYWIKRESEGERKEKSGINMWMRLPQFNINGDISTLKGIRNSESISIGIDE